jgi:hypothetical protein
MQSEDGLTPGHWFAIAVMMTVIYLASHGLP